MKNLRPLFFALTALFLLSKPVFASDVEKQAFKAIERKNWDDALANIRSSNDAYLKTAVTWYVLTQGNIVADFASFNSFISKHPNWPQEEKLLTRAEIALLGEHNSEAEIYDWFKKHPPITPAGKLRMAELQNKATPELVTYAWAEGDFTPKQEADMLRDYSKILDFKQHVRRLDRLLWEGKFAATTHLLARVPEGYFALFKARMALANGAKDANWWLKKIPPSLQNDAGLIYEKMKYAAARNNQNEVLAALQKAPSNVPHPELWWKYRKLHIRRAMEHNNYQLAAQLAAKHSLDESDPQDYTEALWLRGWIAYSYLNKPEEAYKHFSKLYDDSDTTLSRSRGAYWAARAALQLKKTKEANDWFKKAAAMPYSFYGQLATEKLKIALKLPASPAFNEAAWNNFINKNAQAITVLRMAKVGAADLTWPFMKNLVERAKTPQEAQFAARLGKEIKRPDLMLRTAREALKKRIYLQDEAYPSFKLPENLPVPAALSLAIMRQESSFNPTAESSAGAKGLMQIMPNTAKLLSKKYAIPYHIDMLFDSSYNTRMGSAYLADLLNKFDGSYPMSIAAYNAGPGRPSKWAEQFGSPNRGTDLALRWIETIPFGETRNYVMRVLENYQVYQQILSGGTAKCTAEEKLIRR